MPQVSLRVPEGAVNGQLLRFNLQGDGTVHEIRVPPAAGPLSVLLIQRRHVNLSNPPNFWWEIQRVMNAFEAEAHAASQVVQPPVPPAQVEQIMQMGFGGLLAAQALRSKNGNMEQAMEALLNGEVNIGAGQAFQMGQDGHGNIIDPIWDAPVAHNPDDTLPDPPDLKSLQAEMSDQLDQLRALNPVTSEEGPDRPHATHCFRS